MKWLYDRMESISSDKQGVTITVPILATVMSHITHAQHHLKTKSKLWRSEAAALARDGWKKHTYHMEVATTAWNSKEGTAFWRETNVDLYYYNTVEPKHYILFSYFQSLYSTSGKARKFVTSRFQSLEELTLASTNESLARVSSHWAITCKNYRYLWLSRKTHTHTPCYLHSHL